MRSLSYLLLFCLGVMVLSQSCKTDPFNPFDDPSLKPPVDDDGLGNLNPTSFEGLYKNIFRPTCANSGCHDGTFPPDFRTMESAYHTLVYHPIVKNNPSGDYTYRVVPNQPDQSVLIERLVRDIDGQSGIMPLSLEPGSDWLEKKDEYIQNIRDWIGNGARDIFGNVAVQGNVAPYMLGVTAFADGQPTPLPKNPQGRILVPFGTTSLELWVSIADDSTNPAQLTHNKIKFSTNQDGFVTPPENALTVSGSPTVEDGYFGEPVNYHHSYVQTSFAPNDTVGSIMFFRVYVDDGDNGITEIPGEGSFAYIKNYFSWKIE